MTSATNRALCLVAVPFLFVPLALDASAQETARPRLPLRQAHQRKERRKTVATRRSLLGFAGGGQIGCDYKMGACSWVCYKF